MGACRSREKQHHHRPAPATPNKILFLGAEDAGKSTIIRQVRSNNNEVLEINPDTASEVITAARKCIQLTLKSAIDNLARLGVKYKSKKTRRILEKYGGDSSFLDAELSGQRLFEVPVLAADEDIRHYVSEYVFRDNSAYFLDNAERICSDDFVPNQNDLLHCYLPTIDATSYFINDDNVSFELVDVPGAKEARKTWIKHFESVSAVVVCASLITYDETIESSAGESTNRLQDTMKLFKEIAASRWFWTLPIMLFLTKADLMGEKIKKIPFKDFFPTYSGPDTDFREICQFITTQFMEGLDDLNIKVYHHVVRPTDASNISAVWSATRDVLIYSSLSMSG